MFLGFRDTASQHLGVVTGRSCGLQIRPASLPKFGNTTMARFVPQTMYDAPVRPSHDDLGIAACAIPALVFELLAARRQILGLRLRLS